MHGWRLHLSAVATGPGRARLPAAQGSHAGSQRGPRPLRDDDAPEEPDAACQSTAGRRSWLQPPLSDLSTPAGDTGGPVGVTLRAGESRRGREATMAAWPMSPPPVVEDEVEATDH